MTEPPPPAAIEGFQRAFAAVLGEMYPGLVWTVGPPTPEEADTDARQGVPDPPHG